MTCEKVWRERERAIDRERESTRDSQQGGRVRCGGGDFIQNKIKRLEGCWLCGDLQTAKRLLGKAPPPHPSHQKEHNIKIAFLSKKIKTGYELKAQMVA